MTAAGQTAARSRRAPKWTFEHTVETPASKEAVWRVLEDFGSRDQWDAVHWARLDGPVAAGTSGQWHPVIAKGFPPQPVQLEEVVPGERLVFAASHQRRVAELHYVHELEETAAGTTRVTHRLELSGPLARLVERIAGRKMAAAMPESMRRLVDLAERTT